MWTGLPARRSASDSTATDLRPKNSSGVCRNLGMYVEGHVFSLGEYSTSPTNSAFPRIFRCSNRGVTAKKLNSRPEAQPSRPVDVTVFPCLPHNLRPASRFGSFCVLSGSDVPSRCTFRFHHVVGPTRDSLRGMLLQYNGHDDPHLAFALAKKGAFKESCRAFMSTFLNLEMQRSYDV